MKVLTPLIFLLAACSSDSFKKVYLLNDLRVLSLKANNPEVNPGDSVNITPFISDYSGAGRALTYSVEGCVDPGLEIGAEYSCTDRSDKTTWVAETAVSGISAPYYTGTAPSFSVTVPTTILVGRSTESQNNGVAYLVIYRLKTGDITVTAIKRIFASTRTTKNSNPTVSQILVNGAALADRPTTKSTLTLTVPSTSLEQYTVLTTGGASISKTEELLYSWYINDGELTEERSSVDKNTEWTPAASVPTAGTIVVNVVRDRRGGEAVITWTKP